VDCGLWAAGYGLIADLCVCILLFLQVSYIGTGRNRFQMEIPESAAKRVPSTYEVSGQRKGYKRYVTQTIKVKPYIPNTRCDKSKLLYTEYERW